jgi:hypothetical protein
MMPDAEDPKRDVIDARRKALQEQMDHASARMSETVRVISFAQIGVTYTLMISNTPFATALMTSHPNFIYSVFIFGVVALLLDTMQYVLMYERSMRYIRHLDRDFAQGTWHVAIWLTFRIKSCAALIGIALLGSVLFGATYFASRAPDKTVSEMSQPMSPPASTPVQSPSATTGSAR